MGKELVMDDTRLVQVHQIGLNIVEAAKDFEKLHIKEKKVYVHIATIDYSTLSQVLKRQFVLYVV